MSTGKSGAFVFLLLIPAWAAAQPANGVPHLAYVYPAGGASGTTVDALVGGQFLGNAAKVLISGDGVQATIGDYYRPLTRKEVRDLREKIQEARKKLNEQRVKLRGKALAERVAEEAGLTPWQVRGLARYAAESKNPKKQPNPQIAETLALTVSVSKGAAPGFREIRILTPRGLSNPIRFQIGERREVISDSSGKEQTIEAASLPLTVNGRILPGAVDRYQIELKGGSTLSVGAEARALIPYIADAVPGWFQAALAVYGPDRREITYSFRDGARQDPRLQFIASENGMYTVEIRDALYRGREDFVYRLSLSKGPATAGAGVISTEAEPNGDSKHAQKIATPYSVRGCISAPGDVDVLWLKGKEGEQIVAEVRARREGSPLDSELELRDSKGRIVGSNDDADDRAAALVTHQADSYLTTTLPSSGDYFLALRDRQGHGGDDYWYALRVGPPSPGFEVRIAPSSISLKPGASAPISIFAIRRDGFSGPIKVELKNAPSGMSLAGGLVPEGGDRVTATVTAPTRGVNGAHADPVSISFDSSAEIGGREVRQTAIPADDVMQAFAYHHLAPAQEMLVALLGGPNPSAALKPPEAPVRLKRGEVTSVVFTDGKPLFLSRLSVELMDPPNGVSVKNVSVDGTRLLVHISVDAKAAKAGMRGNLVFNAMAEPLPSKNRPANEKPVKPRPRFSVGCLPAVPYAISD